MPTIDRNGVSLYYEDNGGGPALFLTHGYGATLRMWDPQTTALTVRYRVVRWDLRGHGRSDSPADPAAYSHAHTVADMAAVLDACRLSRAVVGGLSLGGYMALEFYLAHPDRVTALVLCDTGPGYKQDDARAGWNRYAEKCARAFETKGLAALATSTEVCAAEHRGAEGLVHAARGILVQRDGRVMESLPSIRVPTLLVVGSEDEPFLAGMQYMAKKIPHSEHVVIEGAGHAPNLENSARFNQVLSAFLARVIPD